MSYVELNIPKSVDSFKYLCCTRIEFQMLSLFVKYLVYYIFNCKSMIIWIVSITLNFTVWPCFSGELFILKIWMEKCFKVFLSITKKYTIFCFCCVSGSYFKLHKDKQTKKYSLEVNVYIVNYVCLEPKSNPTKHE